MARTSPQSKRRAARRKTIVMVFGTFDYFHYGHLNFFEQARKYGDRLVVVVGRDTVVRRVKGRAPTQRERERLAVVSHVDIVDRAILGSANDAYLRIRELKPDIIALGYDQRAFVGGLAEMIRSEGLRSRIVRMKAYKASRIKSSNRA